MESEYQYTVPSDDTVPLENHVPELGFLKLGTDTEVLDIPDSLENFEAQTEDDAEKEVVLDSDEEREHKNEAMKVVNGVKKKQSTSGYLRRLDSRVCAHAFQHVDSARRTRCDEESDAGPTSLDTGTRYQEQSITINNVLSSTANRKSIPMDGKESHSQELRNMVRRSLSENVLDEKKLSSDKSLDKDIEKDVTCEHGCARFNNVESPEPAELSQARALDFVDHYLSISDLNLCEDVETRKTNRIKSPASSMSKGTKSLARRVNPGCIDSDSASFDWAGTQNENSGYTFLRKTDNLIFGREGDKSGAASIHQESDIVGLQKKSFHLQSKEKLTGNISSSNNLGTKSICPNEVDRVALNSGMTGQLERQVQKVGDERDTSDIFDVSFDTQMAAEAMEELIYAPPPTSNADFTCQGFDDTFVNSSEGANKNHKSKDRPYLEKAFLGSADKGKQTKRVKRSAKNVNGNVPCSLNEHFEGQRGTVSPLLLKENLMMKEPLTEKDLNGRKPGNKKISKHGRAPRTVVQQKEDGLTEKDSFKEVQKKKLLLESVGCNSDGQCSKDKFSNSSHVAWGTGHYSSVISFKKAEDSIDGSEERTNDIMKSDAPLKRRNVISFHDEVCKIGVRGKRLKLGSSSCFRDTTHPVKQEDKLNPWIYPRRKRTRPNVARHSNSIQLPPSIVVHEKNENRCHTGNHRPCKKVAGLLVYSPEFQYLSERNRLGSSTRQNSGDRNYLEINNNEASSTGVQVPIYLDRSKQSGILDGGCSTPSVGTSGTMKLDALSNGNYKALKVYKRGEKSKQSRKNPSRPPLMKELVRLGCSESLPDFLAKDSRRRRITAKACILFSQNLDANILKQQRKIVARLGFSIASCCSDATHFITDRFVRTRNMLEAIALGKPVVTHLWLESCGQAGYFINEKSYILRDDKKEKEIGFSMPVSLTRACHRPLLEGRRVFTTPNVKPGIDVICCLVKAVHGQAFQKIQSAKTKDHVIPEDLLILSCEEDYMVCVPFLEKGASVYSSELLLNGIVIQKLEYERHQLFKDIAKARKAEQTTLPKGLPSPNRVCGASAVQYGEMSTSPATITHS
ncbi:BRCT domain-containing protein [Abeliophyllum distichum]|uniref:BRCT domain-containing protein n=1 Tax=Abeliophyllum distichum TaxID=126358 RepID=A0ABD1RBS8_9LAMI